MTDWDVQYNVKISSFNEGTNGSLNSLICTDRLATSDGPITMLNNMCMVEGRQYDFTAYIKLLDEEMNPYLCDKSTPYG